MASKEWNDERRKEERAQRQLHLNRKCHDCGKLTSNYRCPACLKKWREKNHVTGDYDPED